MLSERWTEFGCRRFPTKHEQQPRRNWKEIVKHFKKLLFTGELFFDFFLAFLLHFLSSLGKPPHWFWSDKLWLTFALAQIFARSPSPSRGCKIFKGVEVEVEHEYTPWTSPVKLKRIIRHSKSLRRQWREIFPFGKRFFRLLKGKARKNLNDEKFPIETILPLFRRVEWIFSFSLCFCRKFQEIVRRRKFHNKNFRK